MEFKSAYLGDTEIVKAYKGDTLFYEKGAEKTYLYNLGDECTAITGGWRSGGYSRGTNTVFEKRSDHLYLYSGATANSTLSCATVNQLRLGDYSTLHFLVDSVANTQSRNNVVQIARNFIAAQASSSAFTKRILTELRSYGSVTGLEVTISIADAISQGVLYNDKYGFPSMVCDTWNSSDIKDGYIKLYKCWLE